MIFRRPKYKAREEKVSEDKAIRKASMMEGKGFY